MHINWRNLWARKRVMVRRLPSQTRGWAICRMSVELCIPSGEKILAIQLFFAQTKRIPSRRSAGALFAWERIHVSVNLAPKRCFWQPWIQLSSSADEKWKMRVFSRPFPRLNCCPRFAENCLGFRGHKPVNYLHLNFHGSPEGFSSKTLWLLKPGRHILLRQGCHWVTAILLPNIKLNCPPPVSRHQRSGTLNPCGMKMKWARVISHRIVHNKMVSWLCYTASLSFIATLQVVTFSYKNLIRVGLFS